MLHPFLVVVIREKVWILIQRFRIELLLCASEGEFRVVGWLDGRNLAVEARSGRKMVQDVLGNGREMHLY